MKPNQTALELQAEAMRLLNSISTQKAAELFGVSRQQIEQIKKSRNMSLNTALNIFHAFGYNLEKVKTCNKN